jgi:hypothetical protein
MLAGVTVKVPGAATAVPRVVGAGYVGNRPIAGPATIIFE